MSIAKTININLYLLKLTDKTPSTANEETVCPEGKKYEGGFAISEPTLLFNPQGRPRFTICFTIPHQ